MTVINVNANANAVGFFQALIQLICDVKAMEEAVVEMKYDAKKAPLGLLVI